ncbi:PREDICTED: uncharacterized protein LOC108566722 [Nicrophorus vespilloides]|uniref:Uncharacterized protein LOC108566722 n=1 Tax=Nicrophorus vespilloides TaxID=110193 RepID=A0ABM1N5X9_NICVS|nr:PREDICTED: uncharacterized protein LOC108566722 [Nicrophorus vespilloides]
MESSPEQQFKNGHWIWDQEKIGLLYVNHDAPLKIATTAAAGPAIQKPGKQIIPSSIRFKEGIESMEKIYFRRFFQRRVKMNEPEVITLQDIKDVALFLANPKDLTIEFIQYFHLPEIDRFLKSIIIYFHYYLQLWDFNLERREEAKRKLRQPVVCELEDIKMSDLSDLRSMLSREYCSIIMGIGGIAKYHHLSSSTNSLSEKDRRIFEALLCMFVSLGSRFNAAIVHRGKLSRTLNRTQREDRMLVGTANFKESKLKQRSGLSKDLILGAHDYRMLGIGFKEFKPTTERIQYLEKMFAAPEETLLDFGITLGLIGIPREEYDCVMLPRERTSKNFDKINITAIDFVFPPNIDVPDDELPNHFSRTPCKYVESEQSAAARVKQCSMWQNFIKQTDMTAFCNTQDAD